MHDVEAEWALRPVSEKLPGLFGPKLRSDLDSDFRKMLSDQPVTLTSAAVRARPEKSWMISAGCDSVGVASHGSITCHYYSEGPASNPGVTMERMLGSGVALAKIIDSVAGYTAGSGLKVRMAESNSVYEGGKPGISDTLGAALWGVDVMFTLAEARWLGINFHGGANHYTPIAQTSGGAFEPKPLYYAMLLFAYAGRGSLVPIHTLGMRPWLRAFAVRGTGGQHRVILVNTNLALNEHVRLATKGQRASILRLTAHSAESKSGLTFGGASIGPNGDWAPRVAQSVTLKADRFVVEVPAASAAVVQIHIG